MKTPIANGSQESIRHWFAEYRNKAQVGTIEHAFFYSDNSFLSECKRFGFKYNVQGLQKVHKFLADLVAMKVPRSEWNTDAVKALNPGERWLVAKLVKARKKAAKWNQEHAGQHRKTKREWQSNRIAVDPAFRRKLSAYQKATRKPSKQKQTAAVSKADKIRKEILRQIRKGSGYIEAAGCMAYFYQLYIESMWQPGMTWDNYGKAGWVIDHIIPVTAYDLTDQNEVLKCFNFRNTQPLWWDSNVYKSDTITADQLARVPAKYHPKTQ